MRLLFLMGPVGLDLVLGDGAVVAVRHLLVGPLLSAGIGGGVGLFRRAGDMRFGQG